MAAIERIQSRVGARSKPLLSLFFERAAHPDAPAIRELANRDEFSVSHDPAQTGDAEAGNTGRLELLANGLTFDLHGLVPGPGHTPGKFRHRFGLPDRFEIDECEAIALEPGPHLAAGEAMLPVIRSQAWLATRLCELPGVTAVGWAPARSLSGTDHFVGGIRRWLEGEGVSALGLTALAEECDGGLHSEGLAFFTGQELRVEPELAADKDAAARLALELIDELIARGKIERVPHIERSQGEELLIRPSENGRFVRVGLDRRFFPR